MKFDITCHFWIGLYIKTYTFVRKKIKINFSSPSKLIPAMQEFVWYLSQVGRHWLGGLRDEEEEDEGEDEEEEEGGGEGHGQAKVDWWEGAGGVTARPSLQALHPVDVHRDLEDSGHFTCHMKHVAYRKWHVGRDT